MKLYELTYKCDTYSAGFGATDTAVESLEIMTANIKNNSVGGRIEEIIIKRVDKPTPLQDGWGRTIDND